MRILQGIKTCDDEKAAICADSVEYMISSDRQTIISFKSGESLMVDHPIDDVCESLRHI